LGKWRYGGGDSLANKSSLESKFNQNLVEIHLHPPHTMGVGACGTVAPYMSEFYANLLWVAYNGQSVLL